MNDEFAPFPPEFHQTQLNELRGIVRPGMRVLDLGAGAGRTALPLREHGCEVYAVEMNPAALARLGEASVEVIELDFLDDSWQSALPATEYDVITILGNTLMLVHDVERAARLFESLAEIAAPGAVVLVDAIPQMHWPEVSEGYWVNGIDEATDTELRWADDDNMFTLRAPCDEERLREGDRLHRLWTMGELSLLARATGWRAPECSAERSLLVFHRA